MNYVLFLITILIVSVTVRCQEITFSPDKEILRKCIEDNLSKDPQLRLGKVVYYNLAEIIAKRFSHKSLLKKTFNKAADSMYYFIKNSKYNLFTNRIVPTELRLSIREALENCVERRNLPRFDHELKVLADLLDIVLVDWPTRLDEMIFTHEGRSTLRLYAYTAGARLMAALRYFSMDSDVFHRELNRIWMLRAEEIFDGRDREVPYIRHRFTTNRDRMYSSILLGDVHTIDDVDSFISSRSQDFHDRNPFFELSRTDQILRIPGVVESSHQKNDDLPDVLSFWMSRSEYYLQTHLVRCYKIILFILELQLRRINTDADDVYPGPIPYNVMPLSIQDIAWSGVAYRHYLTTWDRLLQRFSSAELEECNSREDLIMIISLLIINMNAHATATTTTTSTTTVRTTSSTESTWHDDISRKGGVRARDCGKYFLPNKRSRTTFSQNDKQPGQKNEDFNYYGHILYVGNEKKYKELDQSMNILASLSVVIEGILSLR